MFAIQNYFSGSWYGKFNGHDSLYGRCQWILKQTAKKYRKSKKFVCLCMSYAMDLFICHLWLINALLFWNLVRLVIFFLLFSPLLRCISLLGECVDSFQFFGKRWIDQTMTLNKWFAFEFLWYDNYVEFTATTVWFVDHFLWTKQTQTMSNYWVFGLIFFFKQNLLNWFLQIKPLIWIRTPKTYFILFYIFNRILFNKFITKFTLKIL